MKAIWLGVVVVVCVAWAVSAEAARDDRGDIVDAMTEFLEVCWDSAEEGSCLDGNLEHYNYYAPANCSGYPPDGAYCSDFLWHSDYLNGESMEFSACGMPYLYGGNTSPASVVNDACNCKALGAHSCHYIGNSYDVSWATGTDCSASVCYALDIPRVNTGALNSDDYGVAIEWNEVDVASYLVKSNAHVVLVEYNWYGSIDILEATGNYPVSRRVATTTSTYIAQGYTARDALAVALGDPVASVRGYLEVSHVRGHNEITVYCNATAMDGVQLVRCNAAGAVDRIWGASSLMPDGNMSGWRVYTTVDSDTGEIGDQYCLRVASGGAWLELDKVPVVASTAQQLQLSAAPNPFNPLVQLRLDLARDENVIVDICNVRGRRVARLYSGYVHAGRTDLRWDGRDNEGREVASGTYLVYAITEGGVVDVRVSLVR